MSNRIAACAVLFACACALEGQQNMFKLELEGKGTSGTAISLDEPKLVGDTYVFRAWPDGVPAKLPKAFVKKITRLTGKMADTVYQIDLNPTGQLLAQDPPTLKNGSFVFHKWQAGTLMSVRKADVRRITPLTGDQAFWAQQRQTGEASVGSFAMEGTTQVVEIGTAPPGGSQGGPNNLSSIGGGTSGINGAPAGNWSYQGTPGTSDAWGPANATMNNGVPQMPAATNGGNPPH